MSLLVTPSIGCSRPQHFLVGQGTIHSGWTRDARGRGGGFEPSPRR
ncbi:hypothetical protein [Streptomyces spiralis]